MDSIMTAAYDQAMVEKYGGGVGFPLSNIRELYKTEVKPAELSVSKRSKHSPLQQV